MELIDRRAVIDLIDRYTQDMSTGYRSTNYGIPSDVFEDEVMALPTVQPERVEGEWIPHKSIFGGLGEKVYTCDKCGYNIGFRRENYCPDCGSYNGGEKSKGDDL